MNIITNRTALRTMNVLFQNGVVDGAGHSSPLIPKGPSRGPHGGGDGPKRPSKLTVITPKVSVTKAIQEDGQDMDEGSLPCTPEMHSVDALDASGRPAEDEAALDSDTRQLVSRFMADFSGAGPQPWRESRALATMKRVVGNLMEKHRYVYNGR